MNKLLTIVRRRLGSGKRGQVAVLFALMLPVIFLFTGLGIDFGMMYLTSARLTRAVDSTALRVVTRYDPDTKRIQELAVTTMQANMPEFLNESPLPAWKNLDESDTYKIVGSDGDFLEMEVNSDDDSNVITLNATAGVNHRTYFLPIAEVIPGLEGKGIRNVPLQEFATAERFPACNILVLDISGSMRGSKANNLVEGVKAFTAEFIDDRDYLSVITFSTFAKTVFPDIPDNEGFLLPTQEFKSGIGGDSTRSADYIVENMVRFAGGTNAAEGMRYAFVQADEFLSRFDADEREKIKVHYVFFTDGQFNTFRGFARGIGYGIEGGSDPANPLVGATYHNGQLNPVDDLPAFHTVLPLASSEFYNNGLFLEPDGSDIIFNGFSRSTGTDYNLNTLVGSLNVIAADHSNTVPSKTNSSLPGINAVIQGYRLQSAQWREMVDDDDIENGNSGSRSNFPEGWEDLFYERVNVGGDPWIARPRLSLVSQEMIPYEEDDTPTPGSEPFPDWGYLRGIEFMKQQRDHNVYFPEAYPASWDPSNPNRLQDEFSEYYPGGRMFANVRSQVPDDTRIGTDANYDTWVEIRDLHEDAIFFEQAGNNRGPDDGLTGNYGSWNYGTERLSDHYPYYTFGGPWNYPNINSGTPGSSLQAQLETNVDWWRIGPPVQFYSLEQGQWVNARDNSGGAITREGDWLAEAQAFLARKQHDAKVFTIRLQGGNAGVGKRMANENNGSRYYPDQPIGLYSETNNAEELTTIFRKIAQRITARLAE